MGFMFTAAPYPTNRAAGQLSCLTVLPSIQCSTVVDQVTCCRTGVQMRREREKCAGLRA